MGESIWTRERRLLKYESEILARLRDNERLLKTRLNDDDWGIAHATAHAIMTDCIRMQEIERELSNVKALVDGMERIDKRMDELQRLAGGGQ